MSVDYCRRIRAALALSCVTVALAGCGTVLKELEQIPEQDAAVIAGVKAALVRDPKVEAAAIRIIVVDGQLVLEGYVDSAEESRRSADIARQNVRGLGVLNHLEVH